MLATLALLACASGPPQTITVGAPASEAAALDAFVAHLDDARVVLVTGDEADRALRRADGLAVELALGEGCAECYAVTADGRSLRVEAGGRLGLQYGLSHVLEALGYRFPTPFGARLPATLPEGIDAADPILAGPHAPEQARRGLHMHTLHPIEPLWGFWVEPPTGVAEGPYTDGPGRAAAVIDWVIKNRGNHLQWVALDDIEGGGSTWEAWRDRTADIVQRAHERGITTGLGIQLFGSGNLQQAFDLVDQPGDVDGWHDAMRARLELVAAAGFDTYDLSFGEFFGEDPDSFIAAVDLAWATLQEVAPGAELSAVVHVGDSPEQRVEYQGEDLIYYMLVQYADEGIVPHVHTVMYYNLYDDAGGAYHHDDFAEHRQMLLDYLAQGRRVAYFPESAYWVAFDNPVPQYLPLYVRSRWTDLASIRADAAAGGFADLAEHVLFSTGWEWGYWQNDAFTLRMGWSLPDDWGQLYRDWWTVDGQDGADLAAAVIALAEAQHTAHIVQRLAPYLAGRDIAMDVGFATGVVAAPDRIGVDEVGALDGAGQAALYEEVLEPLVALEATSDGLLAAVSSNPLVPVDPWAAEVRDGVEIDALRARFVRALYEAALTDAAGGDPGPGLADADAALARARAVVARRHADLHDPLGPVLVSPEVENPTIYDYGYLVRADELCFWQRERIQAGRALEGSAESVPPCF